MNAAEAAVTGKLEKQLGASSPAMLRELRAALADEPRGRSLGRRRRAGGGSRPRAGRAAPRGVRRRRRRDGGRRRRPQARDWLLIRDFRQATRFTRPGVDATTSLDRLEGGELSPADAVTGVRKDLLDAYQARLVTYLDEATQADERGFKSALAENAALAAGLLADHRLGVRGAARRREPAAKVDAAFAALGRGRGRAATGAPSPR